MNGYCIFWNFFIYSQIYTYYHSVTMEYLGDGVSLLNIATLKLSTRWARSDFATLSLRVLTCRQCRLVASSTISVAGVETCRDVMLAKSRQGA